MNIYVSAYLDNNLGDDLMIRLLAHSFPEHEFYLYCPDSYYFPYIPDCRNLHPTSLPVKALRRKGKHQFDAYLLIGGSIFGMRGYRSPLIRYWGALRMGKLTRGGLKSAIVGCNINTFTSALPSVMARCAAKKELKTVGMVTVRDEASFQFVRPLNERLFCCPDMLYTLPEQFWAPAPEKHGQLGISVYRSKYLMPENTTYCQVMSAFCDEYIQKTGQPIHFFAFDVGRENDLLAVEKILGQMKNTKHCLIHTHGGDGSEMLREMAQCGVIIGTRFHSIVLAMRLGVPFVPITYSEKTVNLLRDIGYQGAQFDFTNMDEHTPAALLAAVSALDNSVTTSLESLMAQAGGHMQRLRDYLES